MSARSHRIQRLARDQFRFLDWQPIQPDAGIEKEGELHAPNARRATVARTGVFRKIRDYPLAVPAPPCSANGAASLLMC